jgi:ankyrin repeat protein
MHAAANNAKITKIIIDAGADVNARDSSTGNTPLHWVHTVSAAKLLIKHGADIFAKNKEGLTPRKNLCKLMTLENTTGMNQLPGVVKFLHRYEAKSSQTH